MASHSRLLTNGEVDALIAKLLTLAPAKRMPALREWCASEEGKGYAPYTVVAWVGERLRAKLPRVVEEPQERKE